MKTGGAVDGGSWDDPNLRTYAAGFTISKSYDSVNKTYAISGNTQRISCGGRSAVQTVPINTYVINGTATNLGKITTYNASGLPNYKNLKAQNFIVEILSAPSTSTAAAGDDQPMYARASGFPISKSYNSETGIFTVTGLSQTIGAGGTHSTTQTIDYTVWLAQEIIVIIG